MPIVKVFGKSLLFVTVLYAFFRYAGEFSTAQSVVLTVVSWLGYGLYEKLQLSHKTVDVFTPFYVSFLPKWYELLSDFKLIRGKDDWERLCEGANKLPKSTFNVFREGFSFTVIRPPSSEGLLPGLSFWNNEKIFLNDLELEAAIVKTEGMGFRHGQKHDFFDHPSWSTLPRMVFKWGDGGYEIGLEVQMEWWDERCKSGDVKELANLKQDKDHMCGTTRVVVATLPYSEFEAYYRANNYEKLKKLQDEWDKQLVAKGWQRTVEGDSEIPDPWSRIEHKYFSVAYRSI
jgi:hypothetical protein